MDKNNNYRISFFRPTTDRATQNRNMVLWLLGIWVVAIFGFHIVMRAIEKPTPEPALTAFNEVWDAIQTEQASADEINTFAHATLHVAGKVFISADHRAALDNGITWATFQLADSAQKVALQSALQKFETISSATPGINDAQYIEAKNALGGLAQSILGLSPNEVLAKILPLELRSSGMATFTSENKEMVATCMPKYTIHNRSVLTDTTFLGFPFHYFYTAVFLLILFIGLCWVYCYKIDQYNKKVGIAE
jgi:putative solute:sodium symporter small subunit